MTEDHQTPEDQAPEQQEPEQGQPEPDQAPEEPQTEEQAPQEDDTFPRDYVERLRDENARYRQRARQADDLAQRLHTALVAATGQLQDPTDLPYDQAHLDDPDALNAAVEDLLARKPHLAKVRVAGDIGQGAQPTGADVDLAGLLRARA